MARANREMRTVAIIFGSLFALLVIAGIAVLVLGARVATNIAPGDPAAMQRTAERIARFTVPHGYHIASATNLGIQQSVTLVRDGAAAAGAGYTLQLQRSSAPSDAQSTGDAMGFAIGLAARVVHCEPHPSVDRIARQGQAIAFRAIACDGAKHSLRIETGVLAYGSGTLTIVASGLGGSFDRGALVALVRSIR